jgi:ankyrin repeat protein
VEVAELLIDKGADVNIKDTNDESLLHLAVENGSKEMVGLLLAKRINVKAKDGYGLTALVYAMKNGEKDIVKMIKDAGGSY